MKLNKEEFLRTEFGSSLKECITAWDFWLDKLSTFNINATGREYKETTKAALWCQAQWEVYQMVMRQFYGIDYYFDRTEDYFGVYNVDETDYLFEVDKK